MTKRQLWSLLSGVGIESDSNEHLNEVADENGAYSYDAQDDGKTGSFQSKEDPRLKQEFQTMRKSMKFMHRERPGQLRGNLKPNEEQTSC
jgi:hypothetical protein